MNKIKYLLGIDGGGTKTEFLLTDIAGNKINNLFRGSSNPVSSGIENTLSVLNDGIKEICDGLDISEISVYAGIAGVKSGNCQKLILDFLSDLGFGCFDCGSDIELALETALKKENGTAVIMGTGIVAYTRCGDSLQSTGGRGYLIDKGGSGFNFGSDALNSAFEYTDGRGGSAIILKLVENKLGKKLEEAVSDFYSGGAQFIASFAPVVFDAFSLGDGIAKEIIERNAFEAAKIINAANKKFNGKTVICGGLGKKKKILLPFLIKFIENPDNISFLDEPMVNGAILLARRT